MKFITLVVFALGLVGCASSSNETDFKKVKPKQRVYMGKVDVTMNGQRPDKCELFMNSNFAPNLKLSDDGYVVYKTSDRKPFLTKVRCLHKASHRKAAWHTQQLLLEPLIRPKKRKSVNYFGHVQINWKIDPESTLMAPAQNPSDFRQVGLVADSGKLNVTVADQSQEAEQYLKSNWTALNDFRVETHLVSSLTKDEDEELDEGDED